MHSADATPARAVIRTRDNGSLGRGKLRIWKKIVRQDRIEYHLWEQHPDLAFAGTHLRFVSGWYQGDEMDALSPSPERSRAKAGAEPIERPLLYVLDEEGEITHRAFGNGLADRGARLSGLPATANGHALVGASIDEKRGVSVFANDLENATVDDGDGLGHELEASLGTDPYDPDTDDDGIWDGFEVLGIRGAGLYPDQSLPSWGADPLHKDVFIETDYFDFCSGERVPSCHAAPEFKNCKSGEYFDGPVNLTATGLDYYAEEGCCICLTDADCQTAAELNALGGDFHSDERCIEGMSGVKVCMRCAEPIHPHGVQLVAEVLGRASGGSEHLDNPDGLPGIALHFDNGHDSDNSTWGDWGGVDAVAPKGPDDEEYAWANYGYGREHHLSPIRQGIFHYGVGFPGGGGQGFIKAPGQYFDSSERTGSGVRLIHELGHNLGLEHYGDPWGPPSTRYNYIPHHVSLMNYLYSFCSPNPYAQAYWKRACDPDFLRFSEGEHRYLVDANGARVQDEHGQDIVVTLDPAALDESARMERVTRHYDQHMGLDSRYDLEQYKATWFTTLGDGPSYRVDWDRNGVLDGSGRRTEILAAETENVAYRRFDESLDYGPQLVAMGGLLYSFIVPTGENRIYYRVYHESQGCDPENLDQLSDCGSWLPVFSSTSRASAWSELGTAALSESNEVVLAYHDASNRLCMMTGRPWPFGDHWSSEVCSPSIRFDTPPQLIVRDEEILVFGVTAQDEAEVGDVHLVRIGLDALQDSQSWTDSVILTQDDTPLRSRTAPAVAEDPLDGSLLGVVTNSQHRMGLFSMSGGMRAHTFNNGDYWISHPGSSERHLRTTDARPGLWIERVASDHYEEETAVWTLWLHGDTLNDSGVVDANPGDRNAFFRLGSSFEDPDEDGIAQTVFSRVRLAVPHEAVGAPGRNVSVAQYRGKLRGAAAYDYGSWDDCGEEGCTGWVYSPLADGIFHAQLSDANDLGLINRYMAAAVAAHGLFNSMSNAEFEAVIEANHMDTDSSELAELEQGLEIEPVVTDDPAWVFEPRDGSMPHP